ncbi:hypothetical protein B296_00044736 [Ensete ventricosum]|uniref:Major facilitator superfamily (MFS) profile domain-containing protein n=1 Tax=Ensete ventricosum TaxID=4639 RepID=A0A426YMK8_ENSVE|nr:hypothetical protein B296_00044736 [Ensete ventricosum]
MEAFYWLLFGGLAAVVAALEMSKTNRDRAATSSAFNSFKNNYLLVYSLMMGAYTPPPPRPFSRSLISSFSLTLSISDLFRSSGDWLQGPYVYYLYSQYGYGKGDIGRLFIAGFGSSMLFGTIVGSLADKQ